MYQYRASFVRPVDGDSIYANVDLGFHTSIQDIELRFANINCPGKGKPGYEEANAFTAAWFAKNHIFIINTTKTSKNNAWDKQEYHLRYLAEFLPLSGIGPSLNQQLVDAKLAVPYHGEGPKD